MTKMVIGYFNVHLDLQSGNKLFTDFGFVRDPLIDKEPKENIMESFDGYDTY